jgi:hypothetical protein
MADVPPPAPIEEDLLFNTAEESVLDEAFEAEERGVAVPAPALPPSVPMDPDHARTLAEIKAALAPKPKRGNGIDPALLNKSKRAFDRRQATISRRLPMARVRRAARYGTFVALVALLLLGFSLRTEIVRWLPSLAGLYSAIGLPVNVIGLEFEQSKTLTSFREGKVVMLITSKIRSISSKPVNVPPVLVSLLDANGGTVYEWTVTPKATEMEPGEIMDFSTEVNAPPEGAVTVRLSFGNPRGGASAAALAGSL